MRLWSSCQRSERLVETDTEKGPLYEIVKAKVMRLSLVDDGAYPQSSINVRMEQPGSGIPESHKQQRDKWLTLAV